MEQTATGIPLSFTAVFLRDEKGGYVGFVEELPGVSSQGQSIDEARDNLRRLATVVFEAEREQSAELLEGKDVLREEFRVYAPHQ
jgi:predicted RNase H-like HicB family nuclease